MIVYIIKKVLALSKPTL